MRDSLQTMCDNFIYNRDAIKSSFHWESEYIYPVCAAVFADKRRKVDVEYMKYCRDLLKANTGIFSNFRGNVKLAITAMLAVDGNPQIKMQQVLQVYGMLKGHFFGSEYLSLAAMIIVNLAEPAQYRNIVGRTRHIYDLMKSEHPFLTGGEDSVMAALLALSELSDEQAVREMNDCYRNLKGSFFSGNAVQSLSHVLALGEGSSQEKCGKTMELFEALKDRGCKYGTGYELATLGVLALLPADLEQLVEDMQEVDAFLSGQRGYGFFGVGRKQRLMHAAMLVSGDRIDREAGPVMSSAAITGTISLIAAQQAALCAAVAASSAAAASSSGS